jgi:diguanylate cyclase (GGDEF)-like protein
LSVFKVHEVLVVGVVPLVVLGWFFTKRSIILAACFIYSTELIFIFTTQVLPPLSIKNVTTGLFSYSFFTAMGLVIHKMRKMSSNITDLNVQLLQKNKELKEISVRDHLTNLHNRWYAQEFVFEYAKTFLRQLTSPDVVKRDASLEGKVMIIILADIDNFKQINDKYGHGAGDNVLVAIAKRLIDAVRFDDIVIRWGGEEFLLICPLANKDYLEQIVTNVLNSVNKSPVSVNEIESVTITISAGAVCFPVITDAPHLFSFDKAIMLCDKALYESKSNGRNQARYVVPTLKALEDAHKAEGISIDNFFESRDYSTIHVLH